MGNRPITSLIDESKITYNTSDVLGRGNYGSVYKGKCLGTDVAVKVLHDETLNKNAVLQDWNKEVELLEKLRHPNILAFIAACKRSDGKLMIITELLTGKTVEFLLDKQRVSMSDRLQFAREAVLGMAWLHSKGIVHQDLKLANLLLDSHRSVKIADFGFAQLLAHAPKRNVAKVKGSLFYMSPEQHCGHPPDPKNDVYAFGICLWELLTHGALFDAYQKEFADDESFRKAVVKESRRPPLPAYVCPAMTAIITSCWAASPAARPSFQDLLNGSLDSAIVTQVLQDCKAETIWNRSLKNSEIAPFRTTWKPFIAAYGNLDKEARSAQDLPAVILYTTIVRDKTGVRAQRDGWIALSSWANLIRCFGTDHLLDQLYQVVMQGWFHGDMEKGETERLLKNKPIGKFLVKFDPDNEGCFILSRVASAAKVAMKLSNGSGSADANVPAPYVSHISESPAVITNKPKPNNQSAKKPKEPVVILNKTIQRQRKPGNLTEYHFVIGKRAYPTLMDLVEDLIQRRGLQPKNCDKFSNLNDSLVSLEDTTEV